MKLNSKFSGYLLAASMVIGSAILVGAQPKQNSQQPQAESAPAASPSQNPAVAAPEGTRRREARRGLPLLGKISLLQSDAIEVIGPDGNKISLKISSTTEFRKDREPAKFADFKVGDAVMVRTDQTGESASGATALLIAAAPPGGFQGHREAGGEGRGGRGGPGGFMQGTLGKDYVVGEVKTIDAPKLTVTRVDGVTQTLELNEETSLRRGRDSVTMADIQPGDHISARGALAGDVFAPKQVNVIPPEMWQRVQDMMAQREKSSGESAPSAPASPAAPETPPPAQAPPQPPPELHTPGLHN